MLTPAEEEELNQFFLSEANREAFYLEMEQDTTAMAEEPIDRERWEPLLQRVLQADSPTAGKVISMKETGAIKWWKYAAAAVVVAVIAGLWMQKDGKSPQVTPETASIAPAANKSILRMSNGKTIVLSDANNGIVSQQGNMSIVKLDSGLLAFEGKENGKDNVVNTLITPKGGQYCVILPDGSKVWMNAASELTFPSVFSGKERVVALMGEAYFEVTGAADRPFVVNAQNQRVQVLGTSFNINAYTNEAMVSTTLVTGKVKVSTPAQSAVLLPGQQLKQNESSWQLLQNADVNGVMAWKNGFFSFNKADITTVMRQLERWYDINVVIATKSDSHQFVGEIPRNINLEKAMAILKISGIEYTIKGKTVTITD